MARTVNPKMIILGRESRGLIQGDLAERMKTTQGRMSKVEHGLLEAPDHWVPRLSSVLNYPEEFFYEAADIYPPGVHFYRRQTTLPQKPLNRLVAVMNIRRLHVEKLLLSADIDMTHLPQCDLDEYGSPEEAARAVRQYFQIPYGPIENVTTVLEDAGILVMPYPVGTNKLSGVSFPISQSCSFALLNSEMPSDRYRYTLAHELGHLVMHRLPSQHDMEEEANRFAGEFLMPAREILPQLHNISLERLATLKRYWKVTMGAILQHALRLEQVTERKYKSLRIELTTRGYHRREPPELDPPIEQPILLSELLALHIERLGFSIDDLGKLFHLFMDEFMDIYAKYIPGYPTLRMVPSSH
jgi:Zn-dependent peptidase ImmA (M78 family)/transcriptional regulator with XRE-family HTH domain